MTGKDYDSARLKALVEQTGLPHEAIAPRVGRKRLQVTRAVNGVSASWKLLCALIRVVNEELRANDPHRTYRDLDPRDFLYVNAADARHSEKNLVESVPR